MRIALITSVIFACFLSFVLGAVVGSDSQAPKPRPAAVVAHATTDSPAQTTLKAIDIMKPKTQGASFTPAASTEAASLMNAGYYYWTTYPGTGEERINFMVGTTPSSGPDIEFVISRTGILSGAASFVRGTGTKWGLFCKAPATVVATPATLNALLAKIRTTANQGLPKDAANTGKGLDCTYQKF